MFARGLVQGFLSVMLAWGWAQGFCLRWSIPTDAWLGLGGCFCGCSVMHAIDEPIKMIQQGAAKWQFCQFARWEIDVISQMTSNETQVVYLLNGHITCSCWFKFWKLRLSLLSCGFLPKTEKRGRQRRPCDRNLQWPSGQTSVDMSWPPSNSVQ